MIDESLGSADARIVETYAYDEEDDWSPPSFEQLAVNALYQAADPDTVAEESEALRAEALVWAVLDVASEIRKGRGE